jgi:hypothetical protein
MVEIATFPEPSRCKGNVITTRLIDLSLETIQNL